MTVDARERLDSILRRRDQLDSSFESPWEEMLEWKVKKNSPPELLPNLANAVTILDGHPMWKTRIRLNEFSTRVELDGRPMVDADCNLAREWLQRRDSRFQIDISKSDIRDAFELVGKRHAYHPVRQMLRALPAWDGTSRVEHFWSRYFGAEDTPYARSVARMWLVSAVARVMRPGCQVDYMPILEGLQRTGKSSAIRILARGW
jgi:putative DNA primase/helicase